MESEAHSVTQGSDPASLGTGSTVPEEVVHVAVASASSGADAVDAVDAVDVVSASDVASDTATAADHNDDDDDEPSDPPFGALVCDDGQSYLPLGTLSVDERIERSIAPIKATHLKPLPILTKGECRRFQEERDAQQARHKKNKSKRKRGTGWIVPQRPRHCRSFMAGNCERGDTCRYVHDFESFVADRPSDIGSTCVVYREAGFCPSAWQCRWADDHTDFTVFPPRSAWQGEDGASASDASGHPNVSQNFIPNHVRDALRRRTYDWQRSLPFMRPKDRARLATKKARLARRQAAKADGAEAAAAAGGSADAGASEAAGGSAAVGVSPATTLEAATGATSMVTESCDAVPPGEGASAVGQPVLMGAKRGRDDAPAAASALDHVGTGSTNRDQSPDSLGRLPSREVPIFDVRNKTYLAPLTTVGNLPFRVVCKAFGADITCGEMAVTSNILQAKSGDWSLLRRHNTEDVFGVQLATAWSDSLAQSCELIENECNVDFVDLNVGCPIDLVCRKGMGSALMGRKRRLQELCVSASTVLQETPFTVKMRTGVDNGKELAHKIVPHLREWGVSVVTIHGRSKEQRYHRDADWAYIRRCVEASSVPVVGNGDVYEWTDWEEHMTQTGVATCMVARGALIKPWIFREIRERCHLDISSSERMDSLRTFVSAGLMHWGSDASGVEQTRRFLLEWLSFAHRYVPIGILERVPTQMTLKPPAFIGRDDLETLMGSPNSADWVKLSEMLLGPAPKGASFTAKHVSNAYRVTD